MRKHPILLGLLLLFAIGTILYILIFGVSLFGDNTFFFSQKGEKIGVVCVKGIITDSKNTVEQINKYLDDPRIKAIIVRIDSPGGGVAASQEIYEAILAAKTKKKVVASLGSVAASGGYYVACGADKIVANPGTLTGSIGVIMHFTNVQDTMKKLGLRASSIKSGKYKDIGSPFREMTSDEESLIQNVIDDIYDQFVETVSVNRKISKEKLKEYTDGRIFTGRQALGMGLVDLLGDMDSAAKVAAKLSGIEGRPELIYPKEKGFNAWKYLVEETKSAIVGELNKELHGAYFISRHLQVEY
jgi:protease-4